jgi:hypothetical protein
MPATAADVPASGFGWRNIAVAAAAAAAWFASNADFW